MEDILKQMENDPTSGTNQDRLKFLIDLNVVMFKKLFVADNGSPALVEQIHLNTDHRETTDKKKRFTVQSIISSLIGGIIAAILSIVLFLTFGIN
jgi:hypothetical protein